MCIRDRLQPGDQSRTPPALLPPADRQAGAGGARFRGGHCAGDEKPGTPRPPVRRGRHLGPAHHSDFGVFAADVLAEDFGERHGDVRVAGAQHAIYDNLCG